MSSARSQRIAPLLAMVSMAVTAALQPAGAAAQAAPTLAAMSAASTAHHVPLALLEAIGYTSTHWRMQAAEDGTVGPMRLASAPGQSLDQAATESGRSPWSVGNFAAANFDAGAAWLARRGPGPAADLARWRDPTAALLGADGAATVFDLLASGLTAAAPTGELIRIPANPQAASTNRAPHADAAPTDYPGVRWVAADPNNTEPHHRPADPSIDMVVVHVTQGSYDGTVASFTNPAANASSHYVIRSRDGAITQMVREYDVAWHAGNADYSTRSIGIEHEGFVNDRSWFTEAMYVASARLVATVLRKYDIPVDRQHVIGHNEVPDPNHPGQFGGHDHHSDPGPYWDWAHYMALVRQYAACTPSSGSAIAPTPSGTAVTAEVGADCSLWVHRAGQAGFAGLGGYLTTSPAVTAASPGLGPLYIGVGTDGNLWVRAETQPWQPLARPAVNCIGNPAAAVVANTLHLACRGGDSALWAASATLTSGAMPQVSSDAFHSLGGILTSGPAVAVIGGTVEYDALGADRQVWRQTAASPGFKPAGWYCYGPPALAATAKVGYLACHGTDGMLWYATNPGTGWGQAHNLGGLVASGVGVAAAPTGPTFFIKGLDRAVWERGISAGWSSDGGTVAFGAAAAVS